jgi:hypothetical protein
MVILTIIATFILYLANTDRFMMAFAKMGGAGRIRLAFSFFSVGSRTRTMWTLVMLTFVFFRISKSVVIIPRVAKVTVTARNEPGHLQNPGEAC